MTGYIYAIRAGDRVKIGYSADPLSRFVKIRADSPLPVKLLGVQPGDRGVERKLHERFAEYRVHGEWFRPVGAVAEWAVMLDDPPRIVPDGPPAPFSTLPEPFDSDTHPLKLFRARHKLSLVDLAELVETHKSSLSRIESGKMAPSLDLAMRIERATRGEVTASVLGAAA